VSADRVLVEATPTLPWLVFTDEHGKTRVVDRGERLLVPASFADGSPGIFRRIAA